MNKAIDCLHYELQIFMQIVIILPPVYSLFDQETSQLTSQLLPHFTRALFSYFRELNMSHMVYLTHQYVKR